SDEGDLAIRAERMEARQLLADVARRRSVHAASVRRAIDIAAPGALALVGDRRRLEQALGNLVDNALRHGGGTVRMDARAENGVVVLKVSDDGVGFPPGFVLHAFERFSRADAARSGGGAGLGLAITAAIARAHGGTAHAANSSGGGADVWLALPNGLNAGDAPLAGSGDVG
ncbi:MAG TPA: ATP-binding protein, partial [Gaiellaceae bacterium]|nr:ATP-binding protein [Gaiellaceae bacterium]